MLAGGADWSVQSLTRWLLLFAVCCLLLLLLQQFVRPLSAPYSSKNRLFGTTVSSCALPVQAAASAAVIRSASGGAWIDIRM
jgi:hypothetical protein